MNEIPHIITERVDDIPLLLEQMQRMALPTLFDTHFPTHGNWTGLSLVERFVNSYEVISSSDSGERVVIARTPHYGTGQSTYKGLTKRSTRRLGDRCRHCEFVFFAWEERQGDLAS